MDGSLNQNKERDTEKEETIRYPSGNLLLAEIKSIYYDESERNKSLENKVAITLSILGVLLTIGINELDIPDFKKLKVNEFGDIIIPLILLIVLVFMVIFLVKTMFYVYKSLELKPYKRMNLDGFVPKNAKEDDDIISVVIMEEYKVGIRENREINNEKATYISKVIKSLVRCIALYITYTLMYKIIY